MADTIRVDTDGLRAAGSHADTAAQAAAPGTAQVRPCAHDYVSAGVSDRFSAMVALARSYTRIANGMAARFGVLLDAGAAAYEEQEAASAAALGAAGGLIGGQPLSAPPASAGAGQAGGAASGIGALLGGQPLTTAPPVAAAGGVPGSARDIARLIDPGRSGPGPKTWTATEASLRAEARRLDGAAEQLRAAVNTVDAAWVGPSAEAARVRLAALETWYEGHADYVRGLADVAARHVQDFRQATTQIPTWQAVTDGERELRAANDANVRSGGKLQPAVVRAQVALGRLYTDSAKGFANYTFAAASPLPPPMPPPQIDPAPGPVPAPAPTQPVPTDHPVKAPKLNAVGPPDALGPPATAGLDVGGDEGLGPAGLGLGLDAVEPVEAAGPSEVVPVILGAVTGGVGGALGGLAGAGERMLQGVTTPLAAPMMSGLSGLHPGGGGLPDAGGSEPAAPDAGGSGPTTPDAGGGGEPGGTEPAGLDGPLSSLATPLASVPAAAAPVAAAAAMSPEAVSPSMAPAMGMGMMPPMMGPHGGRSGPENKQLYKERQLKVVAPPNSEPVKGRREPRRAPAGEAKAADE